MWNDPVVKDTFFSFADFIRERWAICPAFVRSPWASGLDDVRNETGPYKSTHRGGSRALVPNLQTTNLGVGGGNGLDLSDKFGMQSNSRVLILRHPFRHVVPRGRQSVRKKVCDGALQNARSPDIQYCRDKGLVFEKIDRANSDFIQQPHAEPIWTCEIRGKAGA